MDDQARHALPEAAANGARPRRKGDVGMIEQLPIEAADVRYAALAYAAHEADAMFADLLREIDWRQHRFRLFGRDVMAPRLSSWIGDADAVYTYSNTRFEPVPWTPTLARLRDDLAERFGVRSNSVLANLYRDGGDSMGWHSDDEPELGPEPIIASLSFGASRTFRFRERAHHAKTFSIELGHGSVLLMAGATQTRFQHALPKRAGAAARVNLTFRWIHASPAPTR